MFARIIATLAALAAYGAVTLLYRPIATIVAGDAAAGQFKDSDRAGLMAQWIGGELTGLGVLMTVLAGRRACADLARAGRALVRRRRAR